MKATVPVLATPRTSRPIPVRVRSGLRRRSRVIRLERIHRVEDIVIILRAAVHI